MDKTTERVISILLLEMGFQPHLTGYRYARTAIEMVMAEPNLIAKRKVTTELYPGIATVYKTTASRVERAIRHSIDIAHYSANQEGHGRHCF